MVNSESLSIENYIENFRKNGKVWIMGEIDGESMGRDFESNTQVPVRLLPSNYPYKIGDTIVFKRGSRYVIHKIFNSYEHNQKEYFVTGGVNPITNEKVDDTTISREEIIGIPDLTKEAITGTKNLERQGNLLYITALGMTNEFEMSLDNDLISQFEGYIDSCYSMEKMKEEFDSIENPDQLRELLNYFKKKYSKSYKEVLYFKLRTKYFSSANLKKILAQAEDFKVLDPVNFRDKIPGEIDPLKIYGIVKREQILKVKDLSEASELKSICWLRLGNHDYSDPRGEGQGISHIIARHIHDFEKKFGLTDPMQIVEFILNIISKETGVMQENGWIFYKTGFFEEKNGKPIFLRVVFDEFGSINSAHPTNFNYMRNKIINLNPNAAQYLL